MVLSMSDRHYENHAVKLLFLRSFQKIAPPKDSVVFLKTRWFSIDCSILYNKTCVRAHILKQFYQKSNK